MLKGTDTGNQPGHQQGELAVSRRILLGQCITLVIFSTLVALVATVAIRVDIPPSIFVLTFGPFIATYVIALLLLRGDRVNAAGWLFMVGTFVGQLGAVVVAEGYRGQAHVSFVNLVLVAGFTMGPRIAALITMLSVALVSAYSLVDHSVFTGLSLVEQDAASQTVALASSIFTTGGLVIIGMRHFRIGLEKLEAASQSSLQSKAIAERAENESTKRAHRAESLATLGRGIIDLRTSESVAKLCCDAVVESLSWQAAILLNQNGLVMGQSPQKSTDEQARVIPLVVRANRWMTPSECALVREELARLQVNSAYAYPVKTPFSQHTLVLTAETEHELSTSELSFLQMTTQLLGAGLGRVIAEE